MVTTPITFTAKTHKAMLAYREHLNSQGYNFTLADCGGNLVSEALQANGFLDKPEYSQGGIVK